MTHTLSVNQQFVHDRSTLCRNGDATPGPNGRDWNSHLFLKVVLINFLVRVLGLINCVNILIRKYAAE